MEPKNAITVVQSNFHWYPDLPPDPHLIAVMGAPRSGNTLMAQLLATGFLDTQALPREAHPLHYRRQHTDARWIIAKRPRASAALSQILSREMRVVCMQRDPRSVITSTYPGDAQGFRVDYPRWRLYDRRIRAFAGHPSLLTVRFEDLISAPARTQFFLSESIGLRQQRPFAECYKHFATESFDPNVKVLNGVRPLDTTVQLKWRDHPERILKTVKEFPELLDDLVTLGYETDHGWFEEYLAQVDPHVARHI